VMDHANKHFVDVFSTPDRPGKMLMYRSVRPVAVQMHPALALLLKHVLTHLTTWC
jgi:hypothetical protein